MTGGVQAQTANDPFAAPQSNQDVVITRSTTKYPSPSGKHHLVFQPDGNLLVATSAGQYVWGMDRITPAFRHAATVHFGGGNIMIRQANNSLVWHAINPGAIKDRNARPFLTTEGVLQLVSANGQVQWASDGKLGVSTPPPAVAAKPPVVAGQNPFTAPQSNQEIVITRSTTKYPSLSGKHHLVFQPDGNLLVATSAGQYIWGMDRITPAFRHAATVHFGGGNIMIRQANNSLVWHAINPGAIKDPNARPVLTPEGVLQLVSANGEVRWASDGKLGVSTPPPAVAAKQSVPGGNNAPPNNAPSSNPATSNAPATNAAVAGSKLPLTAGQSLKRGQKYDSPSRMHQLVFAADGNVVLTGPKGEYIWGFDKIIKDLRKIDRVELRKDGSFVAADANGVTVWFAPMTRLDPSAQLTATFGGALQVVTPKGEVLWSSDGILSPTINVFGKPNATTCTPEPGWKTCIVLNDPKITIMAVSQATQQGINAVANIYTEMTKRFNANYPKNKFDGYKIYLTNGQPWSALENLEPVGSMWPNKSGPMSGNILRGGASPDYLWIDEQMICKRGQSTNPNDTALRTYDQVIHEFGHAIDFKYNLRKRLQSVYANQAGYEEKFPQSIQAWFGAPGRGQQGADPALGLMREIFSSQVLFSCEGYKP